MNNLPYQQHQDRNGNSRGPEEQSQAPEQPPTREDRNRRNHQRNFQKHFAQIEAVSLAVGEIGFQIYHGDAETPRKGQIMKTWRNRKVWYALGLRA